MRWPWILTAALAAGLAANILAAWSFAAWSRPAATTQWKDGTAIPIQIDLPARRSMPTSVRTLTFTPEMLFESPGCSMTLGMVEERLQDGLKLITKDYLIRRSGGWPMRSLTYDAAYPNLDLATVATSGAIPMPEWMVRRATNIPTSPRLPVRPLPLGFIIDTLFYACAALVLVTGPRPIRRYIRHRRNRCLSCGYDRKGLNSSAVCPECGAAWLPPADTR